MGNPFNYRVNWYKSQPDSYTITITYYYNLIPGSCINWHSINLQGPPLTINLHYIVVIYRRVIRLRVFSRWTMDAWSVMDKRTLCCIILGVRLMHWAAPTVSAVDSFLDGWSRILTFTSPRIEGRTFSRHNIITGNISSRITSKWGIRWRGYTRLNGFPVTI